MILDRIVGTAS